MSVTLSIGGFCLTLRRRRRCWTWIAVVN